MDGFRAEREGNSRIMSLTGYARWPSCSQSRNSAGSSMNSSLWHQRKLIGIASVPSKRFGDNTTTSTMKEFVPGGGKAIVDQRKGFPAAQASGMRAAFRGGTLSNSDMEQAKRLASLPRVAMLVHKESHCVGFPLW